MRRGVHHEQITALGQIVRERTRLRRDALLPHQRLLQSTAGAETEYRGGQRRGVVAISSKHRGAAGHEQARQGHGIGDHRTARVSEGGRQCHVAKRGTWRTAGNCAVVRVDQPHRLGTVKIPGHGEHRVVRGVISLEEVRHVIERRVGQMLHGPDQRVMERMLLRETQRRQTLPPGAVRLIVDRPATLVFHDIALRVEFLLSQTRQHPPHAVSLQPERQGDLMRRNGFVVVGPIEPGRPVQGPSRALDEFEMFVGCNVRRPLKEHVFEQVGKTRTIKPLVGRTHVIPQIDRDDRRRVILREHHKQAVREVITLDWNAHGSILGCWSRNSEPHAAVESFSPRVFS